MSDTILQVPDYFGVDSLAGDQAKLRFGSQGDLYLENDVRNSKGRAIVPADGSMLAINFANDFSGGVNINNLKMLEGLQVAPSGTTTFNIVVDANGNVYRGA